ncbi:hypothetical protein B296_00033571 [Ensete ventricosum]|uniref:Uncharacterized protein n=1 Tax=Ensete ventricosum TaxID=4639 RepID=A0A426XXK0_ENSVE|nr:hypothetical protein B296_00033571 [Ensete ventricosum]
MAKPLAGAATHGQAGCRGSLLRPRLPTRGRLDAHKRSPACRWPPVGVVATREHGQLRPARMGGQLKGALKGLPPTTGPTASMGGGTSRRGGCSLARRLPAGMGNRLHRGSGGGTSRRGGCSLARRLPAGMGNRLHRGSGSGDGAMRVKEG